MKAPDVVRWTLLAAVVPLHGVPERASGQESAIDTAAVIRSALSRFPRDNGPVAELAGLLECRPTECRSMAADSVIAALASSWQIRVVDSDSVLPSCVWNRSPDKLPRGLRLQASEIRGFRGQPSMKVTARCAGGPGARHRTFFHEIFFKVEQIDGRWTTTEVLAVGSHESARDLPASALSAFSAVKKTFSGASPASG